MALYLEHFGLKEPPFRITPHTDFFFDGADRGATLEALIYAIVHDEGIVKVSGEVGSGKTMLCRVLMERLPPEVSTIYLATPSLGRDEILHAIADDLDLKLTRERPTVALREMQEHLIGLYAAGRHVVILIDEAHAMPEETLEQVRLLSNLESNRHKLLQIVLFGQPELDETLAKPSLRPLRDRITHAFRMRPLAANEVAKYLGFRMRAAGYRGPDLFTPGAVKLLARSADGLTRRINILADKALLCAFTQNSHAITPRQVRAAVADSEFAAPRRARASHAWYAAAALAAGVGIGAALPWTIPSARPWRRLNPWCRLKRRWLLCRSRSSRSRRRLSCPKAT
jgi:MSHA biogenesis protein MshM